MIPVKRGARVSRGQQAERRVGGEKVKLTNRNGYAQTERNQGRTEREESGIEGSGDPEGAPVGSEEAGVSGFSGEKWGYRRMRRKGEKDQERSLTK
jgi:hypothetical protein